jgi:hypothetical protein
MPTPNIINLSVAVEGTPATRYNTTIENVEQAPGPVEDSEDDNEEEALMRTNAQ